MAVGASILVGAVKGATCIILLTRAHIQMTLNFGNRQRVLNHLAEVTNVLAEVGGDIV